MQEVQNRQAGIEPPERDGNRPVRQDAILADLRRRIVEGQLAPGTRLPTHQVLMRRYRASLSTLQRTLTRLAEDGFIHSVPRRGRFVVDHPPHRYRYALAFRGRPEAIRSHYWTRLFVATWAAAQQINQRGPQQFMPYFDVEVTEAGEPTAGHERLMNDIAAQRVAGVYFAATPNPMFRRGSALAQAPVPLAAPSGPPNPITSVVQHDRRAWTRRALRRLIDNGRRRIAWLTTPQMSRAHVLSLMREAERKHRVFTPAKWIWPVDPFHPDWLSHVIDALFHGNDAERPDGLLIWDDHLVEPTARGLSASGLRVPDDVQVVGHWNFPLRFAGDTPVELVGFDAGTQLRAALSCLDQQQAHGAPPQHMSIEPTDAAAFHQSAAEPVPFRPDLAFDSIARDLSCAAT